MTASTAITPFNFNEHAVRVIQIEDAPWFVATDVAESLGYKSPKDAASYLDDDEKGSAIVRTPGGDQKLTVINESGLYALVLRSRKPEARKFAKWVTSEVLPAIRKTGKYEHPTTPYTVQPSDTLNESQQIALRALLESNVKRLPHDKQAGAMVKGWSKLKAHFGVPYRQIPASEFTEAISIVARHVAEWDVIEHAQPEPAAQPDMNRTRAAFDAAAQAAASVQTAVFNAVLSGNDEWKFDRWLLAFIDDSVKAAPAHVWRLNQGDFIANWPKLVKDVATGECMCSSAELLDMAAACMQRLQQRGGPARLAA